jgi:hypothetical protein
MGWRVLLIAMVGEALTDEERVIFTMLTGREREPLEPVEEFWGVIGRRGGKTRAMATLAAYFAALVDHEGVLAPGARGVIPILASAKDQAGKAMNYIKGQFNSILMLKALVAEELTTSLRLNNSIDIEVTTANFRTVRSMTALLAIADEVAFWRSDDSANPDAEILNGLRPALATTGGPLAVISSPYARRGELYLTHKANYGKDGDPLILVAQGASRVLNPSLPQRVVDRAMEKDAAKAKAEYLAEFRTDV